MTNTQSITSQAITNAYGYVIESGMTVEWQYGSSIIDGIVTGINEMGNVLIDRDGKLWTVAPERLITAVIVD